MTTASETPHVFKLTKDMKSAAKTLSDQEARYLVDYYYICQDDRKRANNQVRALAENEEPHEVLTWLADQADTLEKEIRKALDIYTQAHPMGSWMRQVKGIGPVISAGLLAHIKIEKAPTVGHIWRFAGLDPTMVWAKGKRRPWNAKLKVLCWKAGQSFMKLSNDENCFYGQLYRQRKEYEVQRNESGGNVEQARRQAPRYGKTTDAYQWCTGMKSPDAVLAENDESCWNVTVTSTLTKEKTAQTIFGDCSKTEAIEEALSSVEDGCRLEGDEFDRTEWNVTARRGKAKPVIKQGTPMLPPAQIDARARRWAVKIFLSHLHEAWYRERFKQEPPKPFAIEHLGHAHYIAPPH